MLKVASEIDAPAEAAWNLLVDTTRWADWGPFINQVECDDRIIHLGSRGRVHTVLGFWVRFEITEFVDGESWAWHVRGLGSVLHRVGELGPYTCCVEFDVPWIAGPYIVIARRALHRIAGLLEG